MRKRKSVREYRDQEIPENVLHEILECARLSPSSRARKPWLFYACRDRGIIEALSDSREHGLGFLKDAPAAIVVAGYPSVSDVWIEDCSIAAFAILLEAEDLGLGACWGQIRNRTTGEGGDSSSRVKEICGMDPQCQVLCVIGLGYKREE
ncbi:MAG: nitroreductase family protein [Clostridia bacterium]